MTHQQRGPEPGCNCMWGCPIHGSGTDRRGSGEARLEEALSHADLGVLFGEDDVLLDSPNSLAGPINELRERGYRRINDPSHDASRQAALEAVEIMQAEIDGGELYIYHVEVSKLIATIREHLTRREG